MRRRLSRRRFPLMAAWVWRILSQKDWIDDVVLDQNCGAVMLRTPLSRALPVIRRRKDWIPLTRARRTAGGFTGLVRLRLWSLTDFSPSAAQFAQQRFDFRQGLILLLHIAVGQPFLDVFVK